MKILVTGAGGQLGREFQRAGWPAGAEPVFLTRGQLDIADANAVQMMLAAHRPDVVINAAAYTAVDHAEREQNAAFAINRDGPAHLATACAQLGACLIHVSTDYVFDGMKEGAYYEDDPVNPISVYGASKEAGEQAVRNFLDRHVIVRSSWVFSAHGSNFVKTMLRLAEEHDELSVVADQVGCPTPAADLAAAMMAMLPTIMRRDFAEWGTYHCCGAGATSWHGFAEAIFELAAPLTGRRPRLRAITTVDYPTPARRPMNSVLDCARLKDTFGIVPGPWREGLADVIKKLCGDYAQAVRA